MVVVFEFITIKGHRFTCNFKGKDKKEVLEKIHKRYKNIEIKYICYRSIEEWENVTGLS